MSDLLHSALQKSGIETPPAVPYSRPATPHGGSYPVQIGFVGLGAMGWVMAKNLANHRAAHVHGSPPILVWNRTTAKADSLFEELGQQKVRVAKTLEQIVTECDVIITALANDETVKSVYENFVQTLKHTPPARNKIFVETARSTQHSRENSTFYCGPTGHVMSGDYRSKKEVAYMLVPAVGKKVIDLGGNIEKANTFKLIGNSMILGTLEILAESFTLAEKSGIPASEVHGLVKDIFPAPGRIIRYSERMSTNHFDATTGFSIDGGIKDASSPHPPPDAVQAGKEAVDVLDWSGIVAGTRVAAGLDAFTSKVDGVVEED
ncbi:hypothetical protein K438DRAFT_1964609 [Mycena galopus ATCC 62051]|nr:hypothetical protein K438DRAFT_1964609 [Mycena galopus ATCC 62051]